MRRRFLLAPRRLRHRRSRDFLQTGTVWSADPSSSQLPGAIPISDFRSSANMMKMLRIRTMPARIANELRMRKNMESCFAPLVALSTEIFFSVNAHGIAGGVTAIEGSVLHPVDVEVVVDGAVEYRLFRV